MQTQMTGVRKAAIVVMALGEEHSSKLFKHLQEEERLNCSDPDTLVTL